MDAITQHIQHLDLLRSPFTIGSYLTTQLSPAFEQLSSMGSLGPSLNHPREHSPPVSSEGTSRAVKMASPPTTTATPLLQPAFEPTIAESSRLQNTNATVIQSSDGAPMYLDALVVGAGWGGISTVDALRRAGFTNIKLVDANPVAGGVWTYTVYPGCRNDVPVPMYQFTTENTWKDWTWENRYPYQHEMTGYLHHACEKMDIHRDFIPNTRISAALWNESSKRWSVYAKGKLLASAKYLFAATGDVTKKHIPRSLELRGLSNFKRQFHTSEWPTDVQAKDLFQKRVGIIGTGASGMQIIEALGPYVAELVVFQRTPNLAMPRRREDKPFTKELQDEEKNSYPELFAYCDTTATGLDTDWGEFPVDDPEATERYLEEKWDSGDFWFGNHVKMLEDRKINDIVYAFWRKKVAGRINNAWMREKLAPETPVHAFGTKRPSHESNYFEVFNQSNVQLVDIRETPISWISSGGVLTEGGEFYGLDYLVLATGFDYNIGSILAIDVRGRNGLRLNDKWASSTKSSMPLPSSSSSLSAATTPPPSSASPSSSTTPSTPSSPSLSFSACSSPAVFSPQTPISSRIKTNDLGRPDGTGYTAYNTRLDGSSPDKSTNDTVTIVAPTTPTSNADPTIQNSNNSNSRGDDEALVANPIRSSESGNDKHEGDDSGIWTHLGLTTHGFPNFFFPDGPQAPSAFGVTPRLTEHQSSFLASLLTHAKAAGAATVEPKPEAEVAWRNIIEENTPSLLKEADSWYMGVNIPGRIRQPLCFYGGCQSYRKCLEDEVKAGFPNFDVA